MTSIIGLDPAGPIFEDNYEMRKLSRADAKYVQILHTNFCNFGHFRPIGHVDFYFKGGCNQDFLGEGVMTVVEFHCEVNVSYIFKFNWTA